MPSSPDVRATVRHDIDPEIGTVFLTRPTHAEARLEGFRVGREEGFAVGRAEGRARAEAELADTIDALHRAIDETRANDRTARLEVERLSVELAVELASAILEREIALGATGRDAVTLALGLRRDDEPVRLRLHPLDAASAEDVPHPDVQIIADPSLERGQARAELGDGYADLSIPAALERVREVLR